LCSLFFRNGGIYTGIIELIIIGVSLSMDALAVSVSNALVCGRGGGRAARGLLCGIVFGLYQGVMPVIGYTLGARLGSVAERIDHYIALILLGAIGIKMIYEAAAGGNGDDTERFSLALLTVQGFATSVDALAVGVSFAALSVNIVLSSGIICLITFIISTAGFFAAGKISSLSGKKAGVAGGIALISVGVKIFVSHMI